MTYSLDFRRKVLSVRQREGPGFQQVSDRFDVGVASVVRWARTIEIKPYVRRKARKIDLDLLAKDVADHPDAYQSERAARFGVRTSAICYALKRLGVTYKKSAPASESRRRQAAVLPAKD